MRHIALLLQMEKLKHVHGHPAVMLQQDALPGMGQNNFNSVLLAKVSVVDEKEGFVLPLVLNNAEAKSDSILKLNILIVRWKCGRPGKIPGQRNKHMTLLIIYLKLLS